MPHRGNVPDVDPQHPDHPNLLKGVLLFLVAMLCFVLMGLTARFTLPKVSIFMILFVQSVIGCLFSIPWVVKHGWRSLKTKRLPLISARTVGGVVGFACYFLAAQKITLTNAFLLFNTGPLILPFVIRIWLKKKIEHRLWPGIIIGFIGVICILQPDKKLLANAGALFGLGSGLCFAFNMLSMRLLSYTEKPHAFLFYYFLISAIFACPGAIYQPAIPDLSAWVLLILLGVLASLSMHIFLLAFHHAKASQLSPFAYASVVFSAILDITIFHLLPTWLSFSGMILIIAGGLLTIYYSKPRPPAVLE